MRELFKKLSRRQVIDYLRNKNLARWVTTQKEMDDLRSGDYTMVSLSIRVAFESTKGG
jgi:hypothetical protein